MNVAVGLFVAGPGRAVTAGRGISVTARPGPRVAVPRVRPAAAVVALPAEPQLQADTERRAELQPDIEAEPAALPPGRRAVAPRGGTVPGSAAVAVIPSRSLPSLGRTASRVEILSLVGPVPALPVEAVAQAEFQSDRERHGPLASAPCPTFSGRS